MKNKYGHTYCFLSFNYPKKGYIYNLNCNYTELGKFLEI